MNERKLNVAKREAYELIARIDVCLGSAHKERKTCGERWPLWDYARPREAAAVRRQSMDLTRVLSDLRRPG